jgi:YidC/Oxa1 family membrane protein insertase
MSMDFLYTAVSWVLLRWHQLFTAIGLNDNSGLNWSLSIVFLVITARLLMFRFFVKQVHYQRHMQKMQPKIQKLREQYKNDRQTMRREMTKLQQEEGFNPLSGCLPMLLQIPIFISLFHVLRHLANSVNVPVDSGNPKLTLYSFTAQETHSAATAKLFGAPLAASLRDGADKIQQLGGDLSTTRVVTLVLVLVSAAATFFTQILVRRAQATVPEGTAATDQKLMLYFIPISVLFSGLIFPLGVLLYWFTSNLWTLGQQAYINKFHPHVPPPRDDGVSSDQGPPNPDGDQQGADPTRPSPRAPRVGQRPSRPNRANRSSRHKRKKRRSAHPLGAGADQAAPPLCITCSEFQDRTRQGS